MQVMGTPLYIDIETEHWVMFPCFGREKKSLLFGLNWRDEPNYQTAYVYSSIGNQFATYLIPSTCQKMLCRVAWVYLTQTSFAGSGVE